TGFDVYFGTTNPPPLVSSNQAANFYIPRSLLSASDFTYLGFFDVSGTIATDMPFGQALTHRYVGGALRLLTSPYNGGAATLVEFAVPGSFGGTVSTLTNTWATAFPTGWRGAQVYRAAWWDAVSNRLYTSVALDYPQGGILDTENRSIS